MRARIRRADRPDGRPRLAAPALEASLVPTPGLELPAARQRRRNRGRVGLLLGAPVLGALTLVALAPAVLAPQDPYRLDLNRRLLGPSTANWLGTDQFGRDLLSRLIFGARTTLGASLLVLATTTVVATGVALVAILGPRPVRMVALRLTELFLALPQLIVAFAIVGVLGPGFINTLLALAITGWAGEARVLRGLLAAEVRAPYVEAARSVGASRTRIVTRHVLPAVAGRAAVVLSLRLGQTILVLSSLSFLGLGAQPPSPEWGAMLSEAQPFLLRAPALMILPGLAVVLTVALSNVLADTTSEFLDTRRR